MDEPKRWTCECGYSEAMVEGDEEASLRAWALHVRDAHGKDVLRDTIRAAIDERVEELRSEGKVMDDPFTGHSYWMEEPPEEPHPRS